jgi:ankyrin repeat protein
VLDVRVPHSTYMWKDFFIHVAVIVVGLLIAVGLEQTEKYFHYRQQVPFPDVKDLATVKITLIRTRCFGTCPSYQVEVDGLGGVVFDGGDFVLVPGRHTAHVPEASVRALLEAFQRADYFSAKDSYIASVTDNPTYTTSLRIDGRSKKVVDYSGEMVGMPDSIRTLEWKIDEVAGTERWLNGDGRDTLALLESEKWDFRAATPDNMTMYSKAVTTKNVALLWHYLAEAGPVVAPPLSGASPVCVASGEGDLELVKRMMKSYAVQRRVPPGKLGIPMRVMNQCLESAAEKGDLAMLQYWLDRGADPTMQTENTLPPDSTDRLRESQLTLLATGIISRNASVVQKLLEYKVDMRAPDSDGSLLLLALRFSSKDTPAIVEMLVKAGVDVNQRSIFLHQTPLFNAYNAPEAVKALLAAGADLEARDDIGNTPLIRGAMVEPMVRELLADGADPAPVAKNGDTALKVARQYNCAACAGLIAASLKQRAGEAPEPAR